MSEPFERVMDLWELDPGRPVGVELSNGEQICLVKIGEEVFAFEDRCTHAEFPMSDGELVDDFVIECCLHGAQFDVRDGAVLEPPADTPLPVYAVELKDGGVWIRRSRA